MKYIALVLVMVATVYGVWQYHEVASASCRLPIEYRLGTLDTDFDLSTDEAIQALTDAVAVWEAEVGEGVHFVYSDKADLSIDFVFDERQEIAVSQQQAAQSLDAALRRNKQITDAISMLQETFEKVVGTYQSDRAALTARVQAHNQAVTESNEKGGAVGAIYTVLIAEQEALQNEAKQLDDTNVRLAAISDQINLLSDAGNRLIDTYNDTVASYNSAYGTGEVFIQGVYTGDSIEIYKFSTYEELVTVLAHELGHALGIDHVDDASSLMYYLLSPDTADRLPVLSAIDRAAYQLVCQ